MEAARKQEEEEVMGVWETVVALAEEKAAAAAAGRSGAKATALAALAAFAAAAQTGRGGCGRAGTLMDDAEVGALPEDVAEDAEQEVASEVPLVDLVDDHDRVLLEQRVGAQLAQQQAL
eukprot:141958-Rhodomonas_salina.1